MGRRLGLILNTPETTHGWVVGFSPPLRIVANTLCFFRLRLALLLMEGWGFGVFPPPSSDIGATLI